MTKVRRSIIRPATGTIENSLTTRRIENLQHQLAADQATLRRWMQKLKRAFHAVERLQARINRAERNISNER